MNWRLTDRDVARANFSDANDMMGTATDTMNKGFDAAKNSVDALNTMFDSRLLKTQAIEKQRDLIEQTQVKSEFNRGMDQIRADNPNDPLAQERARNALLSNMGQQGGMYDHQLGQLEIRQEIDPEKKVQFLKDSYIRLENETNNSHIDKNKQASMLKEQIRNLAFSEFGDDASQLLNRAGIGINFSSIGGSNNSSAAAAVAGRVDGAAGSGTPGATGQAGGTPQAGGTEDVASRFNQGVLKHAGATYLPGNPPSDAPGNTPGSTMTAERADNFRLQVHNPDNNELRHLDSSVSTFGEARAETGRLGGKGKHLAFSPYQIIMSHVDEDTYKRAGIEGGDEAPLTLENLRKLAFTLGKERIQRKVGPDEEETELDDTFVGLASRRDEILEKLGVSDLKGSTLIDYANEKYGSESESENLDSLMADLEDDIIETEGSPGTLEAVNYMRTEEEKKARNEESKATAAKMQSNVKSGMYLGEADLADPNKIYANTKAIVVQADQARSNLNANIGIPNYERVSRDGRALVDIIGKEDDGNISWMNGKTFQDQVKNAHSMVDGIKSVAAKAGLRISNAEAFEILKSKYSSDWFGTDIGKEWKVGGGVDKERAKAFVTELGIGDIAKNRQDLAILDSSVYILQSGAAELEDLAEEIKSIKSQAAQAGFERKMSVEDTKTQLEESSEYKALVKRRNEVLDRMKNASSQVFNNPAYASPKNKLAKGVTDATGEGTGDGSEKKPFNSTVLTVRLANNDESVKSLIEGPTKENNNGAGGTLNEVHNILDEIKKDTHRGHDLFSALNGDKLKGLEIIAEANPAKGQHLLGKRDFSKGGVPTSFYPHLAGAILEDGFVLNSREHLEALMKEWEDLESQAIERKQSSSAYDSLLSKLKPEYRKLNKDETNAVASAVLDQNKQSRAAASEEKPTEKNKDNVRETKRVPDVDRMLSSYIGEPDVDLAPGSYVSKDMPDYLPSNYLEYLRGIENE